VPIEVPSAYRTGALSTFINHHYFLPSFLRTYFVGGQMSHERKEREASAEDDQNLNQPHGTPAGKLVVRIKLAW
jgi:hypothetical protein